MRRYYIDSGYKNTRPIEKGERAREEKRREASKTKVWLYERTKERVCAKRRRKLTMYECV